MIRLSLPLVILLGMTTACGDSAGPDLTMAGVAGMYLPSQFITVTAEGSTDQLASGVEIMINLTAQGSTTGRMFVPGDSGGGSGSEFDLKGTWTLSGSMVGFDHSADTLLRNMTFRYEGAKLTGSATFSGTQVRITLTRQ